MTKEGIRRALPAWLVIGAVFALVGPAGIAIGKHSYLSVYSYLAHDADDNDLFAGPRAITGHSGSSTGYTLGYSKEPLEPHVTGNPGGPSAWFLWTAPAGGPATFSTTGSDYDTLLAAYTGDSFGDLDVVDEDDDGGPGFTSALAFTAVQGRTYRIMLDGYRDIDAHHTSGAFGNYVLGWSLPVPPASLPAPPIDPRCGTPGVICGTNGDDTLTGTPGNDTIIGGDGNDTCDGGGGDDIIICGGGNDRILGGPGNDRLSSTTGNDTLIGGPGKDRLAGGPGKDRLFGNAGRDRLNGQGGSDRCVGGAGVDTKRSCER